MQAVEKAAARGGELTYSSYLRLERLLDLQSPRTESHDEPLFIVIHQVSELWIKLCLHELSAARSRIAADDVAPALKMLARVGTIQEQLIHSWTVLGTMTPSDYLRFRDALGTSSGFQSLQYRLLEFVLGSRNPAHVERFRNDPDACARLERELAVPSLYDETLRLMKRRNLPIPDACTHRDFSLPYVPSAAVEAAWARVYSEPERHWDLYELGEKLVDLEERLQRWRHAHLRAVYRTIGLKRGTGGTPGVPYLAKVLEQHCFPELYSVRTVL